MAMQGLGKNQELDSGALLRDARPLGRRVAEMLARPDNAGIGVIILGATAIVVPAIWEVFTVAGAGLCWFYRNYETNKWTMPFRMPKWLNRKDPGELNPGNKKPVQAGGICYIGNERANFPGSAGEQIWATNSDMRTHMLVFGTTGAGKAQPLDAKVHTPTGWRRMGDVKRGDVVTTPGGDVARIDGVFPQGKIPIFKVTFEDGRSTEACGNHLWQVQFKPETSLAKPKGVPTGKALPKTLNTSELVRRLATDEGRFVVPLPAAVQKPRVNLPLDPYVLGYLLADGEFSARQLAFHTQDPEIVSTLRAKMPAGVESIPVRAHPGRYWLKWKDQTEHNAGLHPIREAFFRLGLDRAGSRTKYVPKVYLEASVEQRMALLQGLMDANGGVFPKRGLTFVTQSEKLAHGVQQLVWSLGGISSIRTRFDEITPQGVTRTTYPTYQVSVRMPNAREVFTLKRLQDAAAGLPAPTGLILTSIEPAGEKEAQCIHIDHPDHLYVTDNYIVTHNTEALTSIATNALSWASGFIYVDGKADSSLYAKIYAMARKMGRDDDVLVINLMTGSMDVTQVHKVKMSNTMNPFSTGSADFLTQMVVSLMSESGGDNAMWKDRAISLVSGLMGALCFMRDYEGLLLNTGVIREYLNFPKLYTLYARRDEFPDSIGKALQGYVRSLPGFQEKNRGNQGEDTLKQHGFLEMQFTRIMGSLADTYGHIFMHELAEVDLEDVVLNRRILVVLLPSLEKSPDELRNLGNIVMAALRAMMAKTLGAKIEGDYADVVEAKPTNSPSPFKVILDEYGYYAVKGAAVMFAQARSLGFSMIVAGQDRQALDKASKEEAGSIIANCKIKVSMALEDPTDTFDLFSKAAGETYVSQVSGFSANTGGLMVSYNDMGNASLEKRSRLTLQELKDLGPGEAVVMVGSKIIRSDMFYANIPKAKQGMRINRFLKVKPPSFESLSEQSERIAQVIERLGQPVQHPAGTPDDLSVIADHFRFQQASAYGVRERAIGAFMSYMEANRRMAEGFASSLMEEESGQITQDSTVRAIDGAAAPQLAEEMSLGDGLNQSLNQKRRSFVRDILNVEDDGELGGGKRRRARAAISDDEPTTPAAKPVERPQQPPKAAESAKKPARNEDRSLIDDVVSEFSSIFGVDESAMAEATKAEDAESFFSGDDKPETEKPQVASQGEAAAQDDSSDAVESIADVLEPVVKQGDVLPEPPPDPVETAGSVFSEADTPAPERPAPAVAAAAPAVKASENITELLQEGEQQGAGDTGAREAISTLAQTSGFKDEREFRERLKDIEQGVGDVDDVTAGVNVDVALRTIEDAIEEYPDRPLPPPASAESVLTLLEQLVDNYESRSEPIDGDEKGA